MRIKIDVGNKLQRSLAIVGLVNREFGLLKKHRQVSAGQGVVFNQEQITRHAGTN
jgi:hypothetical protein